MASACTNNIAIPPETTYSSYGWLSPRVSFSRDRERDNVRSEDASDPKSLPETLPDPDISSGDFEFRLDHPVVVMLPADELFSDGKLVPLQLTTSSVETTVHTPASPGILSPETEELRREKKISGADQYLFSPKAPRCSSRWKEILGLKKLYQNPNPKLSSNSSSTSQKTTLMSSSLNGNMRSIRCLLHRGSKSSSSSNSSDSSQSLPLLKDSLMSMDAESISISTSRLSLSSSSSGQDPHEDLPRLSLDSDKPQPSYKASNGVASIDSSGNINHNAPRMRLVKTRAADHPRASSEHNPTAGMSRVAGRSSMKRESPSVSSASGVVQSRGVSVDSPRMNSSGKVVFQSLERSSSSPSSFNGGPRYKHRGIERSYSANVRVTPVLNVPVCSLRGSSKSGSVFGLGQLFSSSPQKKDGSNGFGGSRNNYHSHTQSHTSSGSSNSRNRIDRT